jgi:hypothetical protein
MNRITSAVPAVLGVILANPLLADRANVGLSRASAPPTTQSTLIEAPLTNADVIKLCKLDLGNDIVIAKINQAKAVEFKLDLDGLIGLKQGGVGKEVIAAMLNRTTPQGGKSGEPESKQVNEPEYLGAFFLLDPATGGLTPLERQTGEQNAKVKGMGFGGAEFSMEIRGEKSPLRFKEGQKIEFVVLVSSHQIDPQQVVQLIALESKKGMRKLLVLKAGLSMGKSLGSEGSVPFLASKYGKSSLKIVPSQDLFPGEYSFSISGSPSGQNLLPGLGSKDVFCFGIDADPSNPSSRAERTVPFRTGEAIPLGIVERLITVHSVEVTAWPKAAELQKAEALPEGTTSLTVKFTYSNQGAREWKCRYRVAVLDDKGAEIGLGERDASLDGNQKSDTNRVSVKMRTLDFPKAAKLRVRVLPRLN